MSLKSLFKKQGISNQVISIRHALQNHDQGFKIGLKEAQRRFLMPVSGDGYVRGCNRPTQTIAGDLAYVIPSWVPVHDRETRTIEGVVTKSKVTHTDFPLQPWHTYYDWNFFIRLDRQYTYLHSQSNIRDHGGLIECEWDTAYLPSWAWPQEGNRIWMVGRWIYDCGHPDKNGHKTELHPPKAVATFRSEAVRFAENSLSTQANQAVLFIGRDGGYYRQPINNQDYAFDLYLPPKPYSDAVPKWKFVSKTGTLPVEPQITLFPAIEPRLLRVVIPLNGLIPHPEQYGVIISAGWSDPRNTESAAIQRISIKLNKIFMDGDYDNFGDEWYIYVCINGRWKVWHNISGSSKDVSFTVNLDLHLRDTIHISACGFEADLMHDRMGDSSGYTWAQISNPNLSISQREAIEDDLFRQLSSTFSDENEPLGLFNHSHEPTSRGTFINRSDKGDYRLRYTIQSR